MTPEKIDPSLLSALTDFDEEGRPGLATHARTLGVNPAVAQPRPGQNKPDVTGPGAMIVSALSRNATPLPAELINNAFVVMAGTSMATPFISGLVALLLERNSTLNPAGVKALLASHSSIPGRPAGTFDPKWGFGLIDALDL